MKFKYSEDIGAVTVSAAQLASFARKRRSVSERIVLREIEHRPAGAAPGVKYASAAERKGTVLAVADTADFVYPDAVEIVREGKKSALTDAALLAELCIFGHLFCREHGKKSVRLILTLISPKGEEKHFTADADAGFLSGAFEALLARAFPFAEIIAAHAKNLPDFANAPFPFCDIRSGQRDFINDAYRAIKSGTRLMVSAPTGIGKTMSALYPAVRAVGSGYCDRIFCLCAKNVTGRAFRTAAETLSAYIPELRCITVGAKEKVCPFRGEMGFSSQRCRLGCNLISSVGAASYEARRDAALLELLGKAHIFSPELIEECAADYMVCPYELSLDLSEYCDIIICDYNYAFDFSVRFRRYFEDVRENYVFLIDEAHNLPKRGRDTYSSSLDRSVADTLTDLISEGVLPPDGALKSAIHALVNAFDTIGGYADAESQLDGDMKYGFYRSTAVPPELTAAVTVLSKVLSAVMRDRAVISRAAENAAASVRKFISACGLFDEHYTFFAEKSGDELSVKIICLDPSELLDRAMNGARSSILFSATLSPEDYFADVCGCSGAHVLTLDSPYDPDNLCLVCVDSVKTTLAQRRESAPEVAEIILSTVEAKHGNYIVYFPSYAYLKQVHGIFSRMTGDEIKTVCQTQGMKRAERKAFLSEFEHENEKTTVGFCVLGGMFSEGIDLAGDALIGAVIIGNGMGSITSEQNILREYYDSTRENGMEYAYTYPGFNNVMQAAGRVIRSESDRGIVVLIDERYADPNIQRLFPKYWHHIKFTSDPFTLAEIAQRFWDE